MDWSAIGGGFAVAFAPHNLVWVFVGVLIGTLIGVLPGLGATTTVALLLPITYGMDATSAVILLAGIYYGSMYGGTITSVLLRIPGETASVVTILDGHAMARQGRAGAALGISAIGSFVGGIVATLGLFFLAPAFAEFALSLGPPEYAVLAALGILLACLLGSGSAWKAVASALLGLLLATVGRDPMTGDSRYTFGDANLSAGLDVVILAMGLFGLSELISNVTQTEKAHLLSSKVGRILPTRDELRKSAKPVARGSIMGFLIGVMPGGGGVVSSMASYVTEKRLSKHPSSFGKGAIEGVAGPETANNASSTSAFVPLLTLGLPSNVIMAMLYGALLLQGITPGPSLISDHPQLFWGVIASMVLGNLILLVLNLPMVAVFIQLLRVPVGVLTAFALIVVLAGAYSVNNRMFDLVVLLFFGVLGYLMRLVGFDPAPLLLAFVLSPVLERSVRQALLISSGDPSIFVTRPVSGGLVVAAGLLIVGSIVMRRVRPRRLESDSAGSESFVGEEESGREAQSEVSSVGGGLDSNERESSPRL